MKEARLTACASIVVAAIVAIASPGCGRDREDSTKTNPGASCDDVKEGQDCPAYPCATCSSDGRCITVAQNDPNASPECKDAGAPGARYECVLDTDCGRVPGYPCLACKDLNDGTGDKTCQPVDPSSPNASPACRDAGAGADAGTDAGPSGPTTPTCTPPGIVSCGPGLTFQASVSASGCFPNGTTPPGAITPAYDNPDSGICSSVGDIVVGCAPGCSFCLKSTVKLPPGCTQK